MSTDREREALALLSDPNAVHVNMLSGRIARPTPEQIIHIYGADVLARAAGWMPRPEPGSPEWEAMVARAARELIPDGETPSEGILERAEVMLRAALVTGGAAD